MSKHATLVIDQGTHASRGLLFLEHGDLVYSSQQRIALRHLGEQRVEQDAGEILDSVLAVCTACLEWAERNGLPVTQAALATQRSTVVAWDKQTGKPLAPAINWQDVRCASDLVPLHRHRLEIARRTGLRLSPHYGASKLAWFLQHEPSVQQAVANDRLALGPLVSFLLFNLLEGHPLVVDHGNASRTLLWNIQTKDWDDTLLELFGIVRALLPRSLAIRRTYGRLQRTDVPVAAVHGDQPASLFACGPPRPHAAYVNLGSGAFILCTTGERLIRHPSLLTGLADSDNGHACYYLEGTVNGAATAVDWARHHWGLTLSDEDLDQCLATGKAPPVFFNSVGGLGSPWWRTGLHPRWLDSSVGECPPDPELCMAGVLESILFLVQANLEAITGHQDIRSIHVSGGLSRSDNLCQRLADLTHLPVTRPGQIEATGRGMAWLADRGRGNWRRPQQRTFAPRIDTALQERCQRLIVAINEWVD